MLDDTTIHIGVGILVGLVAGFLMGIYTAMYYKDRDPVVIAQKTAGVVVGTTWLVLHAYLILTGTASLNIFFDAIGSAAVGEILGINLVQVIKSFRGGSKQ